MDILGWNIPLWLILLTVAVYFLYRRLTAKFGIFKELGIPGPRPLPFLGTIYTLFRCPKGIIGYGQHLKEVYKSDVIGTFTGSKPAMMFYDLEAIKQIMVKDFNNFETRRKFDMGDSVSNRMMTVLEGDHWRTVRHRVSPAFSGSKLRRMTDQINQCGHDLVKNLRVIAKAGDNFECKEYTGSFTMDVIGRTFFSIAVDSQNDKNNQFVCIAKKTLNVSFFGLRTFLLILCPWLVPYLAKYLGYSVLGKDIVSFFTDVIEKTMKDRNDHPEEAPKDFLAMMMSSELDGQVGQIDNIADEDLRVDNSGKWSPKGLMKDDILAQCIVFFLAGYTTVADTLSFTLYNLALYPDVQEKAYLEIMQVLPDGEDPDYDQIKKLTYVEMCLDETLRLYSPASMVTRHCEVETVINGLTVPSDMQLVIPIHFLHRDPEAWEEPEKFDPERFTEEAKEARHTFQYMPFGVGPRMCVAQRLAIIESKVALAHILRNFKLVKSDKTEVPLTLKPGRVEAKNGTWLKLEERN